MASGRPNGDHRSCCASQSSDFSKDETDSAVCGDTTSLSASLLAQQIPPLPTYTLMLSLFKTAVRNDS